MNIIGMIHLKTLPGYPQHTSMDDVIAQALADAKQLETGGVDAILIENTDDDPHQKTVGPETIAGFTLVAAAVKKACSLPLGICVLWNDYRAGLAIAKACNAQFVRIPVFTEATVTSSGIIEGNPYDAISYREKIRASDINILADVHVKHAAPLAKRPIEESATEAIHFGADEIIITGRFTGDMPDLDELKKVRQALPHAKIVIGSGVTPQNIAALKTLANSAIVGTYFKENNTVKAERVRSVVDKAR